MTITALQIANALGDPPPTPEQRRIIEAPLEPTLVIAGAGSGKTATMADRVVYLVANHQVRPDQVLGVTFTRKAAGELAERVTGKLRALVEAGLLTTEVLLPQAGDEGTAVDTSDLVAPVISTYHSYAHSLVSEHGLRIGLEPHAEVIGDAQAWQILNPLVENYEHGRRFIDADATPTTLADQVLTLSGDCAEHLAAPEDIESFIAAELDRAEQYKQTEGSLNATVGKLVNLLSSRGEIVELLRRYRQAKRELGVMDYGDLLTYAARISTEIPAAARLERSKYKLVLLDEFQDTSFAQLELFAGLFGSGTGHAVTAVGDPNQSIYAFRGASAGQLFDFPIRFPVADPESGDLRPAPMRQLTVAWRNSHAVLEVANAMVEPFRTNALTPTAPWHSSSAPLRKQLAPLVTPDGAPQDPTHPVSEGGAPILPSDRVPAGRVVYGYFPNEDDENAAIVEQLQQALSGPEQPSCAVLARTRAQLISLARALDTASVPHEIIGGAGLMHVPEVAEVLAYLRVIADPQRSDEMLRILAGARYRLGPRDLSRLGRYAETLAVGRTRHPSGDAPQDQQDQTTPEADELRSLPEALDALPGDPSRLVREFGFSSEAAARLIRAQRDFARLRSLTAGDLAGLLRAVIAEIGLDTELSARPSLHPAQPGLQLEELIGHAQNFASTASHTDLRAFLEWLDVAESKEQGLKAAQPPPQPGAVQLLTIHASKGLEWDVVAVAGMREEKFPGRRQSASNWISQSGDLPWPLRGDRHSMPQWDSEQPTAQFWARAAGFGTTQKYEGAVFKDDCAAYQREEDRRLAYVAVTRARTLLICTGACFYGTSKGQPASEFLTDIRRSAQEPAGRGDFQELQWHQYSPETQPHHTSAEQPGQNHNPAKNTVLAARWPFDPLAPMKVLKLERVPADLDDPTSVDVYVHVQGDAEPDQQAEHSRRPAMEKAAALVRQHMAQVPDPAQAEHNPRLFEAQLVIRRHQAGRTVPHPPGLPSHLSASSVVRLAREPEQLAEQTRRPVPQRPSSAARRGTAIHQIIEDVLEVQAALPEIDELFAAYAEDDQLAELNLDMVKESYRSSPWAQWPAFAVEIPLETSVAGITLRGRVDAVFAQDNQGRAVENSTYERWMDLPRAERNAKMAQCRFELVDWKTGNVPAGQDLKEKELQLAVYRLAFSRLYGVPLENLSAHFLYLDHAHVHTPEELDDAEALTARVAAAASTF